MTQCSECAIRHKAICRSLDAGEIGELSDLGRRQTLESGQVLQWEGDDSILVGNVIEGVLKLSVSTREGREQTLGLAYPGDFIGRPFGPTTGYSVTALGDVSVCVFRRSQFDDFARRRPEVEHELLQRTLGELDHARSWMLLLGRKSAGARVATFLLEMADRLTAPADDESDDVVAFELPFGRQQIADALGLTIETVSRQFTILRNSGIIATPTRYTIEILDREGLEDRMDAE